MTINTPESDNSFHVSVLAGDQSSAFSQELLRLSGPNPHSDGIAFPPGQGDQSSGRVDQLPISIEQLPVRVDPAGNSAVDALPPLTVEQQSQLPSSSVEQQSKPSSSLGEVTNSILDISLGAAAIAAGDIALTALTKSPRFAALATETLVSGGSLAFYTSPKIMAPVLGIALGSMGAATAARHYAVEGLTGQSETWGSSANHVGIGVGSVYLSRYLFNKFSPVASTLKNPVATAFQTHG